MPGRSDVEGGWAGLMAREEESPWWSWVAPEEYGDPEASRDEREIQQPCGGE